MLLRSCFGSSPAEKCTGVFFLQRAPPAARASMPEGQSKEESYVLQDDGEEVLPPPRPSAVQPQAEQSPGKAHAAAVEGSGASPPRRAEPAETGSEQLFQCLVCLEFLHKRCFPKKSNSQCLDCRRADEAAYTQVRGTDQEKKFLELRKLRNEEYRAMILDLRKKCPAKGRGKTRPRFDFTAWFRSWHQQQRPVPLHV